jgi:hypothetical protein
MTMVAYLIAAYLIAAAAMSWAGMLLIDLGAFFFVTLAASLDYAGRVSSNIGCNGGLDRLRRHSEFSYVASRSEDIDL